MVLKLYCKLMSETNENENIVELFLAGLAVDPVTNAPIVILKDETGNRCMPVWIGASEASSIASIIKNIKHDRPMTHDLVVSIVSSLGAKVVKILIASLVENTFHAKIEIAFNNLVSSIDSRPSDAIAIALRLGAPIYVKEEILKKVEVKVVAVDEDGEPLDFDISDKITSCLLYTSPSPRDKRQSRMPSSA